MNRWCFFLSVAAGLVLGVGPAGAAERAPVTLPPFLVEEAAQPLPWRYAEIGGLEVLSCCPDRLTRALVANHHRLHALLGELLPPSLQLKMSGPQTLLFVDSARQPPTSQEVVAHMALTAAEQDKFNEAVMPLDDGRLRRRAPAPRYSFLPNLRLWDRDAQALFAVVKESEFEPNRVALTPDHVAHVLRNRLPALPPWFISGVLTLFTRATFTEDALTLDRLDWPAEAGSAALRGGTEANRALLPLGDFFAGELPPADAAQTEALSLWQAQAALFIRWGLAGRDAPRRAALWKFVERAATEPVNEALFKTCFGLDFPTAREQLTAYLPEAMREKLALRPAQRPRAPDYSLRPASDVEIARIKGDWERLEIAFVKTQFPPLTAKYVEQARHTLRRAYDHGSREPALLAVMGLCEIDAGNDTGAREFLEAADARGGPLRPRAWLELARLRFASLAGPERASGIQLTPGQTNAVLVPLAAARAQEPPLVEGYLLLADVWAASAQPPPRDQFAVLEQGVRIFPRNAELVYRAAELNVRHGFSDTARWLVALGLALAPDAATRARFEALQAKVGK